MKTTQNTSLIAIITACVFSTQSASAAVTQFSGNFNVTFSSSPGFGQTFQGISSIQGTWSFSFNDSVVPNFGSYSSPEIGLQTFSMTPISIGLTSINLTNTKANLTYDDGFLIAIFIGVSDPNGGVNGLDSGIYDDFVIGYNSFPEIAFSGINNAGVSGFQNGATSSGSFTSVPEPSVPLLGLGVAAFFLMLRRSRN